MRALLDLLRLNEATFKNSRTQNNLCLVQLLLKNASKELQILDPELGDEELIKSMAVELAKLDRIMARIAEELSAQDATQSALG